jgi:hypothetical protein
LKTQGEEFWIALEDMDMIVKKPAEMLIESVVVLLEQVIIVTDSLTVDL